MEPKTEGCLISMRSNTTDEDFPIHLNTFNSVGHLLLATSGIPLNFLIAFVIVAYRRLNKKPRNILWLGVTLANMLTLFTILVEFLAFHFRSVVVCKIFVSITGLAYTWLLFNLFLALVDRYVAIVHPLWHRENVNVLRVIIGQAIGAILIILLIKLPFATGDIPLACGIIPAHGKIIVVSNFVLLTMCIITQFIVYVKTRRCLATDNGRNPVVSFVNPLNRQRHEDNADQGPNNTNASYEKQRQDVSSSSGMSRSDRTNLETNAATSVFGSSLLIRHHGGTRRMELEATWSLLIGVLSLMIFTCPTLMIGFVDWGCRKFYGDCFSRCDNISAVTFYAREILLGHLVYNPVMYIVRSREFYSTLTEKCYIRNYRQPTGSRKLRIIRPPLGENHASHHPPKQITGIPA